MHLGREGSARIYQFPVGGRSGLAANQFGRRSDTEGGANLAQQPVEMISDSGWYHEVAIQEAKSRQDH